MTNRRYFLLIKTLNTKRVWLRVTRKSELQAPNEGHLNITTETCWLVSDACRYLFKILQPSIQNPIRGMATYQNEPIV